MPGTDDRREDLPPYPPVSGDRPPYQGADTPYPSDTPYSSDTPYPSGAPYPAGGASSADPLREYPTDPGAAHPYPAEVDPYPADPSAGDVVPTPVPSSDDPVSSSVPAKAPGRRSRAGSAWIAFIVATVVLIFLLVFVLQNNRSVEIHYFGWRGSLSLGVAMLFAAIGGALVAGLFGTVRILQLRARAKKAVR